MPAVCGGSSMRPFFDRILGRVISRKLAVWIAGSSFLALGDLPAADWVTLSLVYIGTQGAVDLATQVLGARSKNQDH